MEEILLKAKGDKSSGNIVGDVMVIVEIQKDAVYEKRGLDIVYKKRISLKESLCGFSFDLKHLNHRVIKINNQNNHTVIPPNHSKTIPKFGFIRDNTAGNLVIEFLVEFPESLTEQQIETIGSVL
jgi:DnaJ family protein A protein 2